MDLVLKNSGIKTLVMTGVVTEGCVESTARGGLFNDYYIVILSDCVGFHGSRSTSGLIEIYVKAV